ncbi:MAG: PorT family protein [Bacteroidales bacterium]|nr:PorT family protein [Bacteroidales bacterium]
MKKTTIILALVTFCYTAFCQEFKIGVRLAFNLCQIDGDATGGYKKGGFNAGALVSYPFTKQFSGQMEINYAGIGAKNTAENQIVNTGYIEVPLLLHFAPTGSIDFGLGLAPSVLVNHTTTENGADVTGIINELNGYRRFAMPGIIDARLWLNPHIGFNVRFAYSLFNIRKEKISGSAKGIFDYGQYHNVLSFGLIWRS